MSSAEKIDGWYWPASDREARRLVPVEAARDIPQLLSFVTGRDLIVQAGGNTGWWPKILAAEFASVITAEPDPANFMCLEMNRMPANVTVYQAAFGEHFGTGAVELHEPNNHGATRMMPGVDVPIVTIDSLGLSGCDALWLDVEGMELAALRGAEATIARCLPMIACEEKGLGRHYGVAEGDIAAWLGRFGYTQVGRVGRDSVYRHHS